MYKQAVCESRIIQLYELPISTSSIHYNLSIPGHIVPDALIIKQTFDATNGTHSDILIPQLSLRKAHDVLLCDSSNDTLNFLRAHAAARGNELAADVFCDCSGTVEGEEDGGFKLGFGALHFGFGHIVGETRPFAECEVNEVIDAGELVGHEVDTPETGFVSYCHMILEKLAYPVSL